MGDVITIASQKGGVGKTTTAVNLAASLSLAGKRVLLIDFDPQGNASSGVGFSGGARGWEGFGGPGVAGLGGFLAGALSGRSVREFVRETRFPKLKVVAPGAELSALEVLQRAQGGGAEQFREVVRSLAAEFEFTIFDCPPSLGGLPVIALGASRHVLIPVQCEYYAMEGLSQILPVIKKVAASINSDLQIGGLLLTMFGEELELCREVAKEVRGFFAEKVFRTVIPRDVVLAEASSHGLPAFEYEPLSRGAWAHLELAKEVLDHGWT